MHQVARANCRDLLLESLLTCRMCAAVLHCVHCFTTLACITTIVLAPLFMYSRHLYLTDKSLLIMVVGSHSLRCCRTHRQRQRRIVYGSSVCFRISADVPNCRKLHNGQSRCRFSSKLAGRRPLTASGPVRKHHRCLAANVRPSQLAKRQVAWHGPLNDSVRVMTLTSVCPNPNRTRTVVSCMFMPFTAYCCSVDFS